MPELIIGVMSDSHDNMYNVEKALKFFREMDVKVIVHLGDIISPFIVKKMAELKYEGLMVIAIYGNNDGDRVLLSRMFMSAGWRILDPPAVEVVNGKKLLMMHGHGSVEYSKELAYSLAKGMNVDAVLYGHTHQKDSKVINGKVVLNPGETYGYLTGSATVAILDLDEMKPKFIEL